MSALVLIPSPAGGRISLVSRGVHQGLRGRFDADGAPAAALRAVRDALAADGAGQKLAAIGVRLLFGGDGFPRAVPADDDVLRRLAALEHRAPLHLPCELEWVRACRKVFPDVPVVLAFESAFFTALPERERRYGIDPAVAGALAVERRGYHGLWHEAACAAALRAWRAQNRAGTPRTLSFCWEPKPEVAGVLGRRPLAVSSGATPLAGLPGETSCGEVDPSVLLMLAQQAGCGPEQVNLLATRESGLTALVGPGTRWPDLFGPDAMAANGARGFARKLAEHRFLLACGAATAALGGADLLVFSGRYAALGRQLGPRLAARLDFSAAGGQPAPGLQIVESSLELLVARRALLAARD